jgi:hypothetical protein
VILFYGCTKWVKRKISELFLKTACESIIISKSFNLKVERSIFRQIQDKGRSTTV